MYAVIECRVQGVECRGDQVIECRVQGVESKGLSRAKGEGRGNLGVEFALESTHFI